MDKEVLWIDDPARYIKVGCRLCGEIWKFPLAYKEELEKNPGWECPHCIRMWREIHA